MKFIMLTLTSVLFMNTAMARTSSSLTASFVCNLEDGYTVEVSENLNENTKKPISGVLITKDGKAVYTKFFTRSYLKESGAELWSFEGYTHSDGVIGIMAVSNIKGFADLHIDISADQSVSGSSVECSIDR